MATPATIAMMKMVTMVLVVIHTLVAPGGGGFNSSHSHVIASGGGRDFNNVSSMGVIVTMVIIVGILSCLGTNMCECLKLVNIRESVY